MTNDETSSYLFAANGRMYDAIEELDHYDFSSDKIASPFNYDIADNTRCGAFKVDAKWRI